MVRRVALVGGAGLLVLGAALLALWSVAERLPEPLDEVARVPERLWTLVVPPRVSEAARRAGLTESEQRAMAALGRRVPARVVWSSNRSGNHDLYLTDLAAGTVRRLTDHPHVDFGSRFSPDGRRVVFVRSQREWVSFRDAGSWDVYVVNADGTGETRIATGGYHPGWTADGTGIVFHRGDRVFRADPTTGRETLLFHGARDVTGLARAGDFELAPDNGRLALAFREPFSGAGVFDLARRTLVPVTRVQACQTSWAPDGRQLVWVEIEGHGGTRIMTGAADGSERRVLMDLPGAHSHEYFPKLSNDGRWLVWGAAAKGHEHDRADYEIFLWQLGTPWERAVRVTFHPGNDQWPDVHVPP